MSTEYKEDVLDPKRTVARLEKISSIKKRKNK